MVDTRSLLTFIACAVAICSAASDEPLDLLRTNPNAESNEGTDFAIGFFGNNPNANPSEATAAVYIATTDSRGAEVLIEFPNRPASLPIPGFPRTISVAPGAIELVRFPSDRSNPINDVRVTSSSSDVNGIHIRSTNGAKLSIVGINDERVSTDTFLALPCKDFKAEDGSSNLANYQYFVFSTSSGGNFATFNSRFLLVACEANAQITYRIPDSTSTIDPSVQIFSQYGTFLVESAADLTGTIITSDTPLAVFVGHECGQVPSDQTACDLIVEQVPPSAAYGQRFFILPFALRESGDIFKIGSTLDNNDINITCTRRTPGSVDTIRFPLQTIDSGEYHEFRTASRQFLGLPSRSSNYRRDFCCIETSRPATVMQYSLGHSQDELDELGDPAMSYVPPVTQYRNNFLISTADSVRANFRSFVSWAIPSQFFDPANNDERNFRTNGTAYLPPPRSEQGSGGYIPIHCSNGQVCGYGGFGPLIEGSTQVSYDSVRDPNAAVYTQVYGFLAEFSYAHPAGYECEPIGLPHITVFDITVREDVGTVEIQFRRTGGNLGLPSRISVVTQVSSEGGAIEGSDFMPASGKVRWSRNTVEPRTSGGQRFTTVTIVDDDEAEPTEVFEVLFTVDTSGYAFPSAIGRVTIIDDDGGTECAIQPTQYSVVEANNAEVEITVVTTRPDRVGESCVLRTMDVNSAIAGSDYSPLDRVVVNFNGEAEVNILIEIFNDDIVEGTENFQVILESTSDDVQVTQGFNLATVDITDTDQVSFGFDPSSYTVDEAEGFARLTIIKEGVIDRDISINFETRDGTASSLSNADYTATTQTLTFLSTQTELTVDVPITDDDIFEPNEVFTALIAMVVADPFVFISVPMAEVQIRNDDRIKIGFNPSIYSVNENDGFAMLVIEQMGRSAMVEGNVTVLFSTTDITALGGGVDYSTITNQPLIFGPGDSSITVQVPIIDDEDVEDAIESFRANLVLGSDDDSQNFGEISVPVAVVNIMDNDVISTTVQFAPLEYRIVEGQAAMLRVILSGMGSAMEITVQLNTQDGSATVAGPDYQPVSSTILTFAPGITELLFPVQSLVDSENEGEEMLIAVLTEPRGANLVASADIATIFIRDPVVIQFDPATYEVTEGDRVELTVRLSEPSDSEVTVNFRTNDGSAFAGQDYGGIVSRTITFLIGQTSATVTVDTINNGIAELTEQFSASLSNPSSGAVVGAQDIATVGIIDDEDLMVRFDPDLYAVNEGDEASISAVLNFEADRDVTVDFFTTDGNATDEGDYNPVSTTLTFPAGQRSASISVETIDNEVAEPDEEFFGLLANPSLGLALGDPMIARVDIIDDEDLTVRFQPDSYSVNEGEQVRLIAVLSFPADRNVAVNFRTGGGNATENDDYNPVAMTVTFLAGETSVTIPVDTRDDNVAEQNEGFLGFLDDPSNGLALGDPIIAEVLIIDDEVLNVQFDPASYTVTEGGQALLDIVLSVPADRDVTVLLSTTDDTATGSEDYNPISTTLTFPAGETALQVPVNTIDDEINEGPESFGAILTFDSSGSMPVPVGPQDTAVVDIIDNDALIVEFGETGYRTSEGDNTALQLILNRQADRPISVSLSTGDISAQDPEDYIGLNEVVTFQAGEISLPVPVAIVDDLISEPLEDFGAQLSSPSIGATVGDADSATVTIEDNDDLTVSFEETSYTVPEGAGFIEICVVASFPASESYTVLSSAVENNPPDAMNLEDFVGGVATTVFPPGSVRECENITIVDDAIVEQPPEETFTVFIDGFLPSPLDLSRGLISSAPVTIVDDDMLSVRIAQDNYRVNEGDGTVTVCVERIGLSADDITVTLNIRESTPASASAGTDYPVPVAPVAITISSGDSMACAEIPITDDDIALEGDETFEVELVAPPGIPSASPDTSTVTIEDNDVIRVSFDPPRTVVAEDIPGGSTLVCVAPDSPSARPYTITVGQRPGDNPATSGVDYSTEGALMLAFSAGEPASICIPITIIDDDISLEGNETFILSFEDLPTGVEAGDNPEADVTIVDDDEVTLVPDEPTLTEGGPPEMFCVELGSPAAQTVTLLVEITDLEAGSFLSPTSFPLIIPASQIMACQVLIAIDDKIALEEDVTLAVMVTVIDPPGIDVTASSTVTIVDNDNLTVSFEQSSYTLSESDGPAETCLLLNCEAAAPVTVTVSSREGSPPQARDNEDFDVSTTDVTFNPGETRQCANFDIEDDSIEEPFQEDFVVTIDSTSPSVPVVGGDTATVTIEDDDDVSVRLVQDQYTVHEDAGVVTICVERIGQTTKNINVSITAGESVPQSATDIEDFLARTVEITIPATASMACGDIPIVDDVIALEDREIFDVTLAVPLDVDVRLEDPSVATVTILDDEVVLFSEDRTFNESDPPQEICVERFNPSTRDITVRVDILNAGDHLTPTSFNIVIPANERRNCGTITLIDDKIALEPDVVLDVEFTVIDPADTTTTSMPATITIIDNDVLMVTFDERDYAVRENAGPAEPCLLLNCEAAAPVTVTISARESSTPQARDTEDFIAGQSDVTFEAGETRKCAAVDIVDDGIVEDEEEEFIVTIDSVSPDSIDPNAGQITSAIIRIQDDDMLSVRLLEEDYRVNEDEGTVTVCVRRDGQSANDITVMLATLPVSATENADYTSTSIDLTIPSSESQACVDIPITDDRIGFEGDETFRVRLTAPPGVPVSSDPISTVTIVDNDIVRVDLSPPRQRVDEDIGSTMVCVESDIASATPYSISLKHDPSGSNPATVGADYTVNPDDLIVIFPEGPAARICRMVGIVDDNVALEGNETFTLSFLLIPLGAEPGDVTEAEITIEDNDREIVVDFVTTDVRVNENNGTAFVCVNRSAVTEDNFTVPIAVTTRSASADDISQEKVKNATFLPFESVTCVEVPIVNDINEEPSESFEVGFGSLPPNSGVRPGITALSTVTIIDDDLPVSSECSIRDSFMVSPFNSTMGYNFRGGCELIAVRSCNGTEPDFSVRVDFLTDSEAIGTVGVFKDGVMWMSRENGSFESNASSFAIINPGETLYGPYGVTVRENMTAGRTEIQVEDGIRLTVIHNYGDDGSISMTVGGGSSLLETCGICGTQRGQLLFPDGSIVTNPIMSQNFVESYRVPAREQSLRPQRSECSVIRNDTVIGDPLFTVPYYPGTRSLCYEVHGRGDTHFNLLSDSCVNVNAFYAVRAVADGFINIVSSIGIRAEDTDGVCRDIRVDLDGCSVSAGEGGVLNQLPAPEMFNMGGITVRKRRTDRVRVSLPNCNSVNLMLWVICERGATDMIRFQIARGANLKPTSHGLLGQFWNVPISVEPFTPPPDEPIEDSEDQLFNVTITPGNDSPPRSFLGDLFPRTWDNTREECLYVGNGQGGPGGEFSNLKGSVIEGRYSDYIVESMFDTDYKFAELQGKCAAP